MSCFLDPIAAARADVEGMGLKNTGGYIFYDGNNGNWLDPSKHGGPAVPVHPGGGAGTNRVLMKSC